MNKFALRVILCLIPFGILASLTIQYHRSEMDKAGATQSALAFLGALSRGDLVAARLQSWGDVMHATLTLPAFKGLRDARDIEAIDARLETSEGRAEYYQNLHKIMLVKVRIRTVYSDDAGNPPDDYILFILTVQPSAQEAWRVAEIGTAP